MFAAGPRQLNNIERSLNLSLVPLESILCPQQKVQPQLRLVLHLSDQTIHHDPSHAHSSRTYLVILGKIAKFQSKLPLYYKHSMVTTDNVGPPKILPCYQ